MRPPNALPRRDGIVAEPPAPRATGIEAPAAGFRARPCAGSGWTPRCAARYPSGCGDRARRPRQVSLGLAIDIAVLPELNGARLRLRRRIGGDGIGHENKSAWLCRGAGGGAGRERARAGAVHDPLSGDRSPAAGAESRHTQTAEAGSAKAEPARGSVIASAGVEPEPVLFRENAHMPVGALRGDAQRIGGAYWMPPLSQSSFKPRGMPSFEWTPTLRSNISP